MRDVLSNCHPAISFTYFSGAILFGMLLLHPLFLAASMTAAFSYALYLNGRRGLRFTLLYLLPMMVVAALVNPLFNHRGVTILGYLSDNPITLESIWFGIAVGVMFGAVILWFSCFNRVMTADKIMHIFGRLLPALSLVLSMVLRFVPRARDQMQEVMAAQRCAGRDIGAGPLRERARSGMKILSILVTWMLEDAIEKADSMKARGYGLPGRTNWSIYRFDARDKTVLAVLIALLAAIGAGTAGGLAAVTYFPRFSVGGDPVLGPALLILYVVYCFAPLALNGWEAAKWRRLRSGI